MGDEATDMSNNEQRNTSIRCVDYTISEEAVVLLELPDMFSNTLDHDEKKMF